MQATTRMSTNRSLGRNVGFFLVGPVITLVIIMLLVAFSVATFQSQYNGRVYPGVTVNGVDLGEKSVAEAEAALAGAFPATDRPLVTLVAPATGQTWQLTPAELGLTVDAAATAAAAFDLGRSANPFTNMRDMFQSWYYGRSISPVLVLDEGRLEAAIDEIAAAVNRSATNAELNLDGETAVYVPGQVGRTLDETALRQQLMADLTSFQPMQIELAVTETAPTINDPVTVSASIQHTFNSPITFYLQEPLDEADLQPVTLPPEELIRWLRVDVTEDANGNLQHNVFIDENAAHSWVSQFADDIYREPVRARFYFDDNTRELVLVAPHVNGRELDVDATVQRIVSQAGTPNRSVPFIVNEIVPEVDSDATAAELGITELITETTTWFYGSSDARKHNIARSAANFYGIVVAPGEEFSFNKYLGSISEADGYEQGFIIIGGQTVEGIGGGVCQVSTTLYQTAFNAGFPITERWPHGYMLGYYNDGEGPGMDATVFSPIVDMKFINNTPHHLLIENYYNEEFEALTFKFYSTSMGRRVEKEMLPWENVTEVPGPEEDRWEFRENLEPGTVEQIDWATEGADVTVRRTVYNADGQVIEERLFESNYLPVPNVFHYGPGVEPYDYSLVPDDN